MTLRVRQPTGNVAWPLVLVEGAEKTGKSYASLRLSASEKVGRTFVFDLGEGTADEYAELGRYEVVDLDGTYADLLDQLRAATDEPAVDGPNVIVIDSATVLWESIKDWADGRARKGRKARRILAEDPDADISIPMNIWNDAGDRWGHVMHLLRYWPGIGVLIARGKEVAKLGKDGQPVAGQSDYKIEAHKTTGFQVTAHVRCDAPKHTRLMSARSLRADVPRDGLVLPEVDPLEHVVFDVLGAGGFDVPGTRDMHDGRSVADAKRELVELCGGDTDRAAAIWTQAEAPKTGDVSDVLWHDLEAMAAEPAA